MQFAVNVKIAQIAQLAQMVIFYLITSVIKIVQLFLSCIINFKEYVHYVNLNVLRA